MNKKIIAVLLIASIVSAGCASTVANPVPVAQVGDETKTCDAIANEMQKMVTAQVTADGDKDKQIGTNAALGVTGIFLLGMQIDKKCPATPIVKEEQVKGGENVIRTTTPMPSPARAAITPDANPAKKLEDLNIMLKKGLITQDEYNTKKTEILKAL